MLLPLHSSTTTRPTTTLAAAAAALPIILFNPITIIQLQLHSSSSSSSQFSSRQYHNHNRLLSLLLKSASHISEARRLHALLLVSGFFFQPPTTSSSSSHSVSLASHLVRLYVKFQCLDDALLVFNQLPHNNNIIAWNSLLRAFVHSSHFSRAIHLYHSMLAQSLLPDNYTYPLILKACSALSDLRRGTQVVQHYIQTHLTPPNVYVQCAMINMFAKCGSFNQARLLFEGMPHKDLASWTAIISGSVHNGAWLHAFSLFKRMRFQGTHPDSVIVAAILPASARLESKAISNGFFYKSISILCVMVILGDFYVYLALLLYG